MIEMKQTWKITLFPWEQFTQDWLRCDGRRFLRKTNEALTYLWHEMSGGSIDYYHLPKLTPLQDAAGGQISYFIADHLIESNDSLMVGQVELFPAHWEMPGWIKCDGQLLNNRQYHLLAYSLATRFGGNGSTTFAVPQLPPVQFTIDGMEIKLAYHIAYEGMYSFTKEPTLSQVALYAAEPDDQWLKCDGRLLSTEEDYALFSLLDTRFGGDGNTTFGIPNLPPLQTPSGAEVPYYICVRGLYPNLQ